MLVTRILSATMEFIVALNHFLGRIRKDQYKSLSNC